MTVTLDPYVFWFFTSLLALFGGWLIRLELRGQRQDGQVAELRLHISENFAAKDAVKDLSDKLDTALAILNRLVGRHEAAGG